MKTRAWKRRTTTAAAALLVTVTLTPSAPAATETGPGAAPAGPDLAGSAGLDRFHQQQLDWTGCAQDPDDVVGQALDASGAQCAEVLVPLDYAEPDGRTITVSISRLEAADPAARVGPLLLNGGGPGGTGLDMVLHMGASEAVAGAYDLIGMDPRFVGRSTPLDCGWPVGHWVSSPGSGKNPLGFLRDAAAMRDLAKRCSRTEGEVLPFATTRNTARDMDVIRVALGEKSLSYLGYSYGTYLGQVYSAMFPGRTDRMVLDGVTDSSGYHPRLLQGATEANEEALREWAGWAAERDGQWGLGSTQEEVLGTLQGIMDAAARKPLRVGDGYRVDDHVFPSLLLNLVVSDLEEARVAMAESLQVLHRAAERKPADPGPLLEQLLEFLLTGTRSHYGSVQTAILCGDVAAPRSPGVYWRDSLRARQAAPFFGALTHNITPCAFWDRPVEAPTVIDNDVPALLVSATGDTRTFHGGALALRERWDSSRLVTLDGAYHHAVSFEYGNACVDSQVEEYLVSGELPETDPVCTV
ncbi:alpha/beta fold hydrolase [Streptomyces sp. ACA25]|uniref:alpha/beta fold hydrolase n=1 Tax=Streptomyces sp. ACA25 TaxID=3022596 RepID=UPI0023076AE2|nr:alpha/beta fold hydrolase [Streptomyces sp. ACA25]MDB1090184.1 alpha/beta fold hydrolase [Streptomyces sp. ACA25]